MTTKKKPAARYKLDYSAAGEALRDFYLRSMRTLDRMMAEQGMSFARFRIMKLIDTLGVSRSADLAAMLGFAPRTVTQALDNLERDGLATRVPDAGDRRVKHIALTALGKEVLRSSEPIRQRFGDQLFEVLDKGEIDQLAQLLGRLNGRLVELEQKHKKQP